MLQDRVTRVEEERDSLRLALKFLMQDQSVNNATPSAVDSGNCWKTVKRAKTRIEYQSNPSLNNKPGNKSELNTTERETQSSNEKANGNGSGGEPVCTWCQNDYIVLEDLNESCKIIDDIQAKSRVDRNESDKAKTKSKSHTKRQKTIIVGDSIVKGLQQHKFAKAAKQNVQIKCFPGATVQDMNDYVKPVLRKKSDTIILHVGTNSTSNKEAGEIINDIDKLCQQIKEMNPDVELVMSELINREDNPKANKTVKEVNKLLEDYCTATNLNLITHRNILDRSLNRSKLHLNRFGPSSLLAKNFISYLHNF